jgi:hypothetical protein
MGVLTTNRQRQDSCFEFGQLREKESADQFTMLRVDSDWPLSHVPLHPLTQSTVLLGRRRIVRGSG